MRAVVQRSRGAHVSVDGEVVGSFDGPGLVLLVGVTHDDTPASAARLADKAYDLRIFGPEHAADGTEATEPGREVSASDLGLPILVISQFTLYGETRKGRRPTWDAAAPRPVAEPLVDEVVRTAARARGHGVDGGLRRGHAGVAHQRRADHDPARGLTAGASSCRTQGRTTISADAATSPAGARTTSGTSTGVLRLSTAVAIGPSS